jgi:hypothetical protein
VTGPRDEDELLEAFAAVTAAAGRPSIDRSAFGQSPRLAAVGVAVIALVAIVGVAVLGSRLPGPAVADPSGTVAAEAPPAPSAVPTLPTADEAWRLVATLRHGGNAAYRVHAATSEGEFEQLWAAVGDEAPLPAIDLSREIAVSFSHGVGTSCPNLVLDEVVIDRDARKVFSVTSNPDGQMACSADLAGAVEFVVAINRDALPPRPFTVQLNDPQSCAGMTCASVEVDLSDPTVSPAPEPSDCPAALAEGFLVEVDGELAVQQRAAASTYPLIWQPWEYEIERRDGELAVVDTAGNVVAREGDYVRLGGGEINETGVFTVCGQFEVVPSPPDPSPAPITSVDGEWRLLPPSPIGDGRRTTSVWTGTEFIVWGAAGFADGAAYNPTTNTWRPVRGGPRGPARDVVALWTGDAVVAWHGGIPSDANAPDGGVYDPLTDTWSAIAPHPLNSEYGVGIGWTGTELLLLSPDMRAAAYKPVTNSWRDLPSPPLPPGTVEADWTGAEWLVHSFGTNPDAGGGTAAFSPATNEWTQLALSGLTSANDDRRAVWAGEVWLWSSEGGQSLEYDRVADEWRTVETAGCWIAPSAIMSGNLLVSPGGAFDLDSGDCYQFPSAPELDGLGFDAAFAWTGAEVLLWGGSSGTGDTTTTEGAAFRPTVPFQPEPEPGFANCRTVLMPDPMGELDTSLSVEEGLLDIIAYGDGGEDYARVVVEYLDPACLSHPVLGPLIDSILVEALANSDDTLNCDFFRQVLQSGSVGYGGEPISTDQVDSYVGRWCVSQTAEVDIFCTQVGIRDEPTGEFPRTLVWTLHLDDFPEVIQWMELTVSGANDGVVARNDSVSDQFAQFELGLKGAGEVTVESLVAGLLSGEVVDVTQQLRDNMEIDVMDTDVEINTPNDMRQLYSSCPG